MWLWRRIKPYLDRRWKRIAFIFWAPLFLVTWVLLHYAAYHTYAVYVASDTWRCHWQFAGFRGAESVSSETNKKALALAQKRMASRFSGETREIENRPEFVSCMSLNWDYGHYWKYHRYIWLLTSAFTFCTIVFGLLLFTNVLSRIGRTVRNEERH